jgi:hypothetical protein
MPEISGCTSNVFGTGVLFYQPLDAWILFTNVIFKDKYE